MCKCKCKVCNKTFEYGDENSPCLTNKKWRRVVNFYNLRNYEKRAERLYAKVWDLFEKTHYSWGDEYFEDFEDKDEYHLYICSDCMEKALGRKILPTDLLTATAKKMGMKWYYNKAFEESYFKSEKVS